MAGAGSMLLAFVFVLWLPNISQQATDDVKYFNIIEKLHVDLLTHYNKQIRPVRNHIQTLGVEISMKPTDLDFDEMSARISVKGFFFMKWKDPRFVWAPAEYEGLQTIHIPSHLIWTPDLEVFNMGGKLSTDRTFATDTQALVSYDGTVIYVPLTNLISQCVPTLDQWPYDKQECAIRVGSWTHNTNKMLLSSSNNETTVDLSEFGSSATARWNLLSTKVESIIKKYSCCEELYQTMVYTFKIQRRSATSCFTIIIPTFVIVALTLATFFIPPMVGGKLIVGVVNLVLICGYLMHFNTILPSSEKPPMIVEFYGATLVLTAISVIASIAAFSWTRLPKSRPPPEFILRCLTCCSIDRLLGVNLPKPQMPEEQKLAEKREALSDNNAQKLWICLSLALHRILFCIYCITFAGLIKCCIF